MEWLFLAAGTGLYAMSKSKNMKQIDKVILLIATKVRNFFQFIADGKKAGGFQGMSKQLSSFLTSQGNFKILRHVVQRLFLDQAGGFKEKMDKAEASKILSVSLDANEKEINQAFRQLMIANHPDKGGSRYISEKGTITFQSIHGPGPIPKFGLGEQGKSRPL